MRRTGHTALVGTFALAVLLTTTPHVSPASTVIHVDSASGEANVADTCTLRDAITAANTDAAVGGCSAGGGSDEIELLEKAQITLTEVDNDSYGPNGLPSITTTILIKGNDTIIERDPDLQCSHTVDWPDKRESAENGEFRLLHVGNGGNLTVRNVVLQNGCPNGDFPSDRSGGAIAVNGGELILEGSILRHNAARDAGGALYHNGGLETEVRFSEFRSNHSYGVGGAIGTDSGITTVYHSLIEGNTARISGGGLFVSRNRLNVINSTVSNNTSEGNGGGIGTSNTTFGTTPVLLALIQSTLSGNVAEDRGGAISALASLDIQYSSLIGNQAFDGSGIHFGSDTSSIDTRTISGSVLAGEDDLCGAYDQIDLEALGENLATDDTCPGFTMVDTDPMVAPLSHNGGATPTHALSPESPAIDAINECPLELITDQRGLPRPGGGSTRCDLGAFEYQSPLIFSDQFEAGSGTAGAPSRASVRSPAAPAGH